MTAPVTKKRAWDYAFFEQLTNSANGAAIQFALTDGKIASGVIQHTERTNGELIYVSGTLSSPEPGKFFFQKQTLPGKQGDFAGVVEFPGSKTAWRIEPTGPGGKSELVQHRLDEVICYAMPPVDPALLDTNTPEEMPPLRPDQVPDYVPYYNSGIISLQSLPGATGVLYIDYRGGYTPTWGGITYDKPVVTSAQIKDVWKRVAEDYMPFNINVTTDIKVYLAAPENSRQRCICTPTTTAAPGAGGVSYLNSWNWTGDTPNWSFYSSGKAAAEVIAHECGHAVGLSHETTDINGVHTEYFTGQGSGVTGWAPIMGAGYYQNVTTWSKGEYQYAGNLENQLNTITTQNNNVAYRTDDTGATLATARYLEIYSNYTAFAEGVIETTGDTDAFRFTTAGGTVSLTAYPVATNDWANLAVMATLADATDTVIASNNPQNILTASLTTNLPAGTYTFRVTGAGRNNPLTNGFSNYASLGYYSVTGSVANATVPTRFSIGENATNGFIVGTVTATNLGVDPLNYFIVSGNTSNTFVLNNNGVLTVTSAATLNYETLALKSQYAVQFEMFVNITNTANPLLTELNRRVVVQVTNVNEAPFVSGFTNSIFAHTQPGSVVGTVNTSDPDFYTVLTLAIVSGNSNAVFAIDSTTGNLSVNGDLDPAVQSVYTLAIQATDNGTSPLSATNYVQINVLTNASPFQPGTISYAIYDGIGSGNYVSNLTSNARFPTDPTSERQITSAEGDSNRADSYGSVLRGYLIPPTSGNYTFYIATDDNGELWMSTSTNPASMTLIANITGSGNAAAPEQWNKYSSQTSVARALTAGQAYYIEARHKEGTGNDNLAVGWSGPATSNQTNVIAGLYLAPNFVNYVPHLVGFNNVVHRDALAGSLINQVTVTDVNTNDLHTFSIVSGNSAGIFDVNSNGWVYVANDAALVASVTTNFTLSICTTDNGTPALSGTNTAQITIVPATSISASQIQQEMFTNIGSLTTVASLTNNARFPGQPDTLVGLTSFASPVNVGDNYGSRIRAYLVPSVTGDYQFFISSDDNSLLLFSRDTNAANAVAIASVSAWTSQNVWSTYASQTSAVITNLIAGQRYYIEALHKEGGGGDHVEVGWLVPGSGVTNIIPSANLQVLDLNYAPTVPNQSFFVVQAITNGAAVGTIAAQDSALDTLTFKIIGGNPNNTFAIAPSSGALSLADNSFIAGGSVTTFALSVAVQDSGYGGLYPLHSATNSVFINVIGTNTLFWDAGSVASAQDGNGNWATSPTNWWNGFNNSIWTNNSVAVFGLGTATNCTVTITNDVTPTGISFNINSGGTYTLAGNGGSLNLSTPTIITANADAAISASIKGGSLVKNGPGKLMFSGTNTYSGTTLITSGALLVNSNAAAAAGTVTVLPNAAFGGKGKIGGVVNYQNSSIASFTLTPTAATTYSNSTYLTFTNAVFMTNVTVGVTIPTNLGVGTYVLATNYMAPTVNGNFTLMTNSGSLVTNSYAAVSVVSNNLILTVSYLTGTFYGTNAYLTNLVTSAVALTPIFASGTFSYNASVPYSTANLTVTPTALSPYATIAVNGSPATSGSPSGTISLNVGANVINTVVVSQDSSATNTYTLTVTRAAGSTNAYLTNLVSSAGAFNPIFASNTLNYTASVPYSITNLTMTPTAADSNATIKVNGSPVISGSPSSAINLSVGTNLINTAVISQDTTVTNIYTLTVTRAVFGTNAYLTNLVSSAGTFNPIFTSNTYSYTASVPYAMTNLTLTPTTADSNATIKVNGSPVVSGSPSSAVNLSVGTNVINAVVVSYDTTVTNIYTLTITRNVASTNAYLTNLVASVGTLNPAFTSNIFSYTASVPYPATNLTVIPTAADVTATIQVNGNPVVSGSASTNINLIVGTNFITTVVVSENLTVTNIYNLAVIRDVGSSNAYLANLVSSAAPLDPVFATNFFTYTNIVTFAVGSLTVTPTAADTNATIKVNGSPVISGNASTNLNLNVGTNLITTVVISQNATMTNTYLLTVTRGASVSRWWDGGGTDIVTNGDGSSGGGGGTWDTTITNWDQGNGQIHLPWNNMNANIAVFGGAAGTVTNTVDITVGGLTFTNAYTITNAPGTSLIFNAAGTISNSAAVTIATPLTGTGPITKTGAGTLTLTASNSYTGGTVLNAGQITVTADNNLGTATGGVAFSNTVTLNYNTTTLLAFNRPFTINANALATISSGNGGKYNAGSLVGAGTLNFPSTTTLSFTNANNTFSGPITATTGNSLAYGLEMASIGDGAGAGLISLNNGSFRWLGYSGSTTTFINRQFALSGTTSGATISALGATANDNLVIKKDLVISGIGNKTLVLAGVNTGLNTFAGSITNGPSSSVISLTKAETGTWALGGTNTYSGATTFNSGNNGTTIFQGLQALSPNTAITQNQVSSGGSTLKLLDDSGGVVTNNATFTLNTVNGTGIGSQANFIFVGNNSTANGGSNPSSAVTGETIAVRKLTMIMNATSGGSDVIGWQTISGANGYRLQINGVDLPSTVNISGGAGNNAAYFVPTTANVTLAGNIQQLNGNNKTNQLTLQLDGTATANFITGNIKDADDFTYSTNVAAKPLKVTKSNTSTWTLSGTNTYSGATTISAGMLTINGSGQLGGGSYAGNITNNGILNYASSATQILSGVFAGTGSLTNAGTGSLLINGNAAGFTNVVTVLTNTTFGGTGILGSKVKYQSGSLAWFKITPEASDTYSNSTYMTFTNSVFLTNVTVSVSMPTNLGNGSYVLATNYVTPTTNGSFTFVTNSGSLASGCAGGVSVVGNNLVLTVTNASSGSPTITGATNFASAFSTTYGTASLAQTFAVSGTNLTAAITATAAPGFEISTNATYGNTLTVPQTGGIVSGVLSIRLAATAPAGTYNSSNIVVLTSAGATSITNRSSASSNVVNQASSTWSYTNIVFAYDGTAHTPTISFSGSTGLRTTNYVGTGTPPYANVNAPTNVGTYYVSNTMVADMNYLGATNSQVFTIKAPGTFSGVNVSGTSLTLTVTNGTPGAIWILLQSTNLATPVSQWQTNCTGTYDGSGNLSTNILNITTNPLEFYLLK